MRSPVLTREQILAPVADQHIAQFMQRRRPQGQPALATTYSELGSVGVQEMPPLLRPAPLMQQIAEVFGSSDDPTLIRRAWELLGPYVLYVGWLGAILAVMLRVFP